MVKDLKTSLLFAITLISHLPFLWAGYGREEDAWAQALNAKIIWETGVYEVSRLPGHPLYELLLAGLWPVNHSYFFFNFLSALATSLAVVLFYKIAKKLNLNSPFVLSLALSFVPVLFIAGNYTIDYNFSLCLILGSLMVLLDRKFILAGILIGLATGFRISSIAFLLPLSIFFWSKLNLRQLVTFWVVAGIVAAISFIPPLMTYGMAFLDFHKPPFPSWANIIYEVTLGVWGVPMIFIVAFIKLTKFRFDFSNPRLNTNLISSGNLIIGTLLIWALQLLVFIRLPFKAEFFIPAIPFLMLITGAYFNSNQIRIVMISAILSAFTFGFDYYNPYRGGNPSKLSFTFEAAGKEIFLDPLKGPAVLDVSKRNNKSALVDDVLKWCEKQDQKCYVIAGWYWPEIELKNSESSLVQFDYYSTVDELMDKYNSGYSIYYLPEINEANSKINAHYLADSLGQPLIPR